MNEYSNMGKLQPTNLETAGLHLYRKSKRCYFETWVFSILQNYEIKFHLQEGM